VLSIDRARTAVGTFLPLALTVATMGPIAGVAHLDPGVVVLGAAICLTTARRMGASGGRHHLLHLARVPVLTAAVAALGMVFSASLMLGDAFFVLVVLLAGHARRLGPRAAAVGRAAMLPLIALFIAPVRLGDRPGATLGWAVLACLVATGWTVGVALVVPAPRLTAREVARQARRLARSGRQGTIGTTAATTSGKSRRDLRRLHAAALALDAALPVDAGPARRALCAVGYRADRVLDGQDPPARLDDAVAALEAAMPTDRARRRTAEAGPPPADPAEATRLARVAGRRANQSALGLALAFAAGQLLFPAHWSWTVVTAFTVSVGARSRGEVLVKSVERFAGALAGTTAATLAAGALVGHPGLSVAVILCLLAAGLYLREISYAWWAFCFTGVLAVLYGLIDRSSGPDLLGIRLVESVIGAVCAVVPAAVLRPIRTRDVVRKRIGDCLRSIRAALDSDASDVGTARGIEVAIEEVRRAARPLLVTRQVRYRLSVPGARTSGRRGSNRAEAVAWVDELSGCLPAVRALPFEPPESRSRLRTAYATIGREVKASRTMPMSTVDTLARS
jgi:Fusaric acid resistance protein-like